MFLLPQYCGITVLIDVCSNMTHPEEKKDPGDIKQGELLSHIINSSSPSFSTSIFPPHHSVRIPNNSRSRPYIQRYLIGTHIGGPPNAVASPSSSSMIAHPRSNSPSAGPAVGVDPSPPPPRALIRIDSDDGDDIQTRLSQPDTDNDDGMIDNSANRNRINRVDTDNDVDFTGIDENNDMTDID